MQICIGDAGESIMKLAMVSIFFLMKAAVLVKTKVLGLIMHILIITITLK